jgi:membrane fusion protein (multidrug efflux system)
VLRVQLKDAQQQLAYNKILAPVAGRIGKRTIEVAARAAWPAADRHRAGKRLADRQLQGNPTGGLKAARCQSDHRRDSGQETDRQSGQLRTSGAQFALLPADNATGNFTKIVQRVPVKIVFKPEDESPERPPGAGHVGDRRSSDQPARKKPR